MTHNDNNLQNLIAAALQVRENAYVPYSHYPVGAALHTPDGTVFTGCNIENAAYPAGICAERAALAAAVSAGVREFDVIVVATDNGGSPCGICRQMLYEFAPGLRVVTVNAAGEVRFDLVLSDLLPHGFGPHMLDGD